jgi:hypothetical protein
MRDINRIFELANEVENIIFDGGLKEFDKLVLFRFLYDNHLRALINVLKMNKVELMLFNREIKKELKLLKNMTFFTIDNYMIADIKVNEKYNKEG